MFASPQAQEIIQWCGLAVMVGLVVLFEYIGTDESKDDDDENGG